MLRCCIIVWPMIRAEVCIFFNRKLMRGCRTRKVSSFEVDAFDSPLMKPLLIGESRLENITPHLTRSQAALNTFETPRQPTSNTVINAPTRPRIARACS